MRVHGRRGTIRAMPPRRTSADEAARLRLRVAVLEQLVDELSRRLLRVEGKDRRVRRARPGDGRARPRIPEPPSCPGCATPVSAKARRCPLCGCIFTVLPPSARPAGQLRAARGKRLR